MYVVCVSDNGTKTQVGSLRTLNGTTLQCVRDSKNQLLAYFREVQQGCVDEQGNNRAYNEKWVYEEYQYQCVLSNVTAKINRIGNIF